jgi:nitroimidazol reductase NimA-like FMN-containing flavoprotein (pyridoxamine 5'-phosphate oxidase superfamily)
MIIHPIIISSEQMLTSPGKYDLNLIHTIIQTSFVAHVSFSPSPDDPFPAILPMIAVMGSYDRPSAGLDEPLDCYLHGYVSSRIMNLSRAVCGTSASEAESAAEAQASKGFPVAISAAKVDGLVLSLTPNSHSMNYRSAVLFGYATPVSSPEEKLYAMQLIMEKVVPGRWAHTRVPPNAAEMSSTNILRVRIENGSAKVRDGAPVDEKADLANEELVDRVWTGVIPVRETMEEPVPGVYNRVKEMPGHIKELREGFNTRTGEYVEKVNGNIRGSKDA